MASVAGSRGPMPDRNSRLPTRRACGYMPTGLGAFVVWVTLLMRGRSDSRARLSAQARQGGFVGWRQLFRRCDIHAHVADAAVVEAVDPAVHAHGLPARPGILQHGRLADVDDLLDRIELAQARVAQ